MRMNLERYMQQALDLSIGPDTRRGLNPRVGCVIVNNDEVVGQGAHLGAGTPHAEVHALAQAGAAAKGATAIVTLEPCCHTGRTGPCTQALIDAGISRVIYAQADTTAEASGGAEILRHAGIEVTAGILADQAAAINADWFHLQEVGRPWIIGKIAVSLDGRVDSDQPERALLTGTAARDWTHALRATCDAIAVGTGTVIRDNPKLTVRGLSVSTQPLRVIMGSRVIDPAANVFCEPGQAIQLNGTAESVAKSLGERGVQRVLIEGGPTVLSSFLAAGIVDEMHWLLAPVTLGAGPLAPPFDHTLPQATVKALGEDVLMSVALTPTPATTQGV
jgi:diaminohydroxyphosphoribosylaminopyrimidine deaminase / 5-amino-6-(5-phosphoribosylamino)uracil reductase